MVALKLQQFQHNLKKIFLQRLVFPMLLGGSDGFPPGEVISGGGGGDFKAWGGGDVGCHLRLDLCLCPSWLKNEQIVGR